MKHLLYALLILSIQAHAQTIPFTSPRWKVTGQPIVQDTFQNIPCAKFINASAYLQDANFTNGIIEFDMAVKKDRYFPGMSFRMQDTANAEEFYIRPHQSGNPDALQYYPEYFFDGGWQLYYGDGFGTPYVIPMDRWFHVKLLVKDTMAEVYLDTATVPTLFIKKLYRPVAGGMIALKNPYPVPAWFAKFTYTATNNVTLKSVPKRYPALPANVFNTWQVSSRFDEKLLAGKSHLSAADTSGLSWQTFTGDNRGVADLGMLGPAQPGKNTVFAKQVIHSDKAQVKQFTFGFSDRVRVYFGGKLLYFGTDGFTSRDYRFLGTMGLYDAVYLDLKKGDNEVWLAVSEDFGGWGVMARLDDL